MKCRNYFANAFRFAAPRRRPLAAATCRTGTPELQNLRPAGLLPPCCSASPHQGVQSEPPAGAGPESADPADRWTGPTPDMSEGRRERASLETHKENFCSTFVRKTHWSRQETVTRVHPDGRSLALRTNQTEPQVVVGSTGGPRWRVDSHVKLLTGSRHAGHDGDQAGKEKGQRPDRYKRFYQKMSRVFVKTASLPSFRLRNIK